MFPKPETVTPVDTVATVDKSGGRWSFSALPALLRWLLAFMLLVGAPFALAAPSTPTEDFTDNLDGTVTHRITGLTWMRCAMGMTWDGTTCTGTASTYTWDQAIKLTVNFAGKTDWRLPSIAELNTIVERESSAPTINVTVFPNTPSSYPSSLFWSGSPDAGVSNFAWGIYFDAGDDSSYLRSRGGAVRLVRSGQSFDPLALYTPSRDFVDNSNGTVTHLKTGLMWKRCAEGQAWSGTSCTGTASSYDWNTATALTSSSAGYNDWRIPMENELLTIGEYQAVDPAINTSIFPNTTSSIFWSGQAIAGHSSSAWYVFFYGGGASSYVKSLSFQVRLVRPGQFFSPLGFAAQTDVAPNAVLTSNALKIAPGISAAMAISIVGGSYAINGGAYTTTPGTVFANDSVTLRITSASGFAITSRATLTVGGVGGNFSVTTRAAGDNQKPSVPADLTATARADNTIILTWAAAADNVGVTSYRIYRNGIWQTSLSKGTAFTDVGLSPATAYSYSVSACDAADNCSAQSAVAAYATKGAVSIVPRPTTPTDDFADNGDGTVTHRITGLTWMRCAMGMTWIGSTCTGTSTTYTWDQATKLTANFAGKSDWRLPSIAELTTIVERTVWDPSINGTIFPNTSSLYFWSASADVGSSSNAWYVDFSDGSADGKYRSESYAVRLVRVGQSFDLLALYTPSKDFVENSDGTVNHLKTGLMWKRCAEGQTWSGINCSGTASNFDWNTATALTSSSAGYDDWRIPTANELLTIVEYRALDPAINTSIFPNTASSDFGSGSRSSIFPLLVNFDNGGAYFGLPFSYAVRLVRAGQFFSPLGFKALTSAVMDATVTSTALKVYGTGGTIAITNGQYAINNAPYTSTLGTINSNDTVTVRLTSASTPGTTTRATLTIGTISGDFVVTTAADTQVPSPPATLNASASNNNQITLNWPISTDNTAVTTYRLYRNGALLATTGTTTYTDPQPTGSGKTNYNVQACDAAGNCSALSSAAAVTRSGTGSAAAKLCAGGNHGAALNSDGSLLTWGSNDGGQLGLGVTTSSTATRNTPQTLGTGFTNVELGGSHSVALKQDGSLWIWGANASGQIGDGSTITRNVPIPIGSGYMTVAAGNAHTLGIKNDGSLWSWGNNGSGQLGDGTSNPALSPVQVGSGFYTVAGGTSHSVAIKLDATLWAWGSNNFGQLGDGTGNDRYAPNLIGKGFTSLATGAFHTIALKNDGSLWAWGKNDAGQLGDGTTQNRYAPVQIGTGFSAIAAGASHTLATKTDGTVWAWGANESGQLGSGTTTQSLIPQKIAGIAGITAIAAGGNTSLGLQSDGSVLAWGSNNTGQLGDGTFGQRPAPVLIVKTGSDGFLNLSAVAAKPVPPALNVPFFVSGSGSISATSATVSTTTRFNPADQGKIGAVYVTAMVPNGSPLATLAMTQGGRATVLSAPGRGAVPATASVTATAATPGYTLVQLTPTGWLPVVGSNYMAYSTGVLNDLLASQSLLNNTDTSSLKGAEFCVGYGLSAADMMAHGNIRVVATIPGDQSPTSCVLGSNLTAGVSVAPGWNLLGNPVKQTMLVAQRFGDASKVISVWKWDHDKANWQFYSPTITASDLQTYVAGQGYSVLSEINGGEGYWVNAKVQADLGSVSGDAVNLRESSLATGWNLMATADLVTPPYFNLSLSTTTPIAGQLPINLTSLWAWDNAQSKWFFYAPSLEAQGGNALADYITSHHYRDFGSTGKTLGNGVGFWVRRP